MNSKTYLQLIIVKYGKVSKILYIEYSIVYKEVFFQMYGCVKPICCPPEYCVRDYYTQRVVPVIHPIVIINRQNVIDVPQHYYQQTTRNVVVNQGFQANRGYTNRLFF